MDRTVGQGTSGPRDAFNSTSPSTAPLPGYERAGRRPGGSSQGAREPCSCCPLSPLLTGTDTLGRQAWVGWRPCLAPARSGHPPRGVSPLTVWSMECRWTAQISKGTERVQPGQPGCRPVPPVPRPQFPGPGSPLSPHPYTEQNGGVLPTPEDRRGVRDVRFRGSLTTAPGQNVPEP